MTETEKSAATDKLKAMAREAQEAYARYRAHIAQWVKENKQ